MSRLYFDVPCRQLADWAQLQPRAFDVCGGIVSDGIRHSPHEPMRGTPGERRDNYWRLIEAGVVGGIAEAAELNRRQREAWRAYQHRMLRELMQDRERRKVALSRLVPHYLRKLILFPGVQCSYCGTTEKVGIDHMIPWCQGGTNAPWNLTPACLPCNEEKGGRTVEQWLRGDPLPGPLGRPVPSRPPRWEVLAWLGGQIADAA